MLGARARMMKIGMGRMRHQGLGLGARMMRMMRLMRLDEEDEDGDEDDADEEHEENEAQGPKARG